MQHKRVDDDNGDGVDNSDDSKSDSNRCVNDGKEGVDYDDDDNVDDRNDGGDMHLTHLIQVENN
eukprot:1672476-Ditylum_brightwellii.AAC.2